MPKHADNRRNCKMNTAPKSTVNTAKRLMPNVPTVQLRQQNRKLKLCGHLRIWHFSASSCWTDTGSCLLPCSCCCCCCCCCCLCCWRCCRCCLLRCLLLWRLSSPSSSLRLISSTELAALVLLLFTTFGNEEVLLFLLLVLVLLRLLLLDDVRALLLLLLLLLLASAWLWCLVRRLERRMRENKLKYNIYFAAKAISNGSRDMLCSLKTPTAAAWATTPQQPYIYIHVCVCLQWMLYEYVLMHSTPSSTLRVCFVRK